MSLRKKLTGLINSTLHNQSGLAAWFLPGMQEIHFLQAESKDIITFNHPSEIANQTGFAFAPFQSSNSRMPVFLKGSPNMKGLEDIEIADQFNLELPNPKNGLAQPMSKEDYLKKCNLIIGEIKSGQAGKVVLSRYANLESGHENHPAGIFLKMNSKYSETCCYLFYTPQTGFWMGATPETLLWEESGSIRTMALAGTRQVSNAKSLEEPWPEKELLEQKFVTDYIHQELTRLGITNIEISKPYASRAGKIEHIRTDFVISGSGATTGEIINALHPTPAICGMPKNAALQIINNTEDYQRDYYTGYLGPVKMNSETRLFVNLRCMKVHNKGFTIFAGGGITSESNPESEWNETEMKLSVMKSILMTD